MDGAGVLIGGFDRRLTRQEEWSKLDDGRMDRLERKIDQLIVEMAEFRAEIRGERGDSVTKADLGEKLRHSQSVTWTAAGVIIAALGLMAALLQVFESQALRPVAPAAPAPIIIQLPAQPTAAATVRSSR